jgi:hypothetical protein
MVILLQTDIGIVIKVKVFQKMKIEIRCAVRCIKRTAVTRAVYANRALL